MGLTFIKRKDSQYWYLRGTIKGILIHESTGISHGGKTRPSKLAEDYRIKRILELEQTAVYGRANMATFLDAATSYLDSGGSPRFLGSFDEEGSVWTGLIGKIGHRQLKELNQTFLNEVAIELYPDCKRPAMAF